MYSMTIIRRVPNPAWTPPQSQMDYWDRQRSDATPQYLEERSIVADLTDDEWECIKRALVQFWATGTLGRVVFDASELAQKERA